MRKFFYSVVAAGILFPALALAHEVYVLAPSQVEQALLGPPLPIFTVIGDHMGQFFFWVFITVWAIFTVLSISLSKPLERRIDPLLAPLKRYAPLAGRVTLGLAIIASGQYGALFGPELAFSSFLPVELIPYFKTLLIALGTLITFGLFTRIAGLLLALLYISMWSHYGFYMLTYINYFGEIVLTIIVGNATHALDRYFHHLYPHVFHEVLQWMEKHAFLILRVAFGVSLIFASFYAKFLHADLALTTVAEYGLTAFFPFEPSFLVLGAFAIELLLGLFFVFGIEIRFASIFLLFWLTLSLLYFKEAVWPHVILAGTAIAIGMRGYDTSSLEWGVLHRRNRRAREPFL